MIPNSLMDLKKSGKVVLADCLTFIQTNPENEKVLKLLDDALINEGGYIIGVTGPPGVGKSSLINRLVSDFEKEKKKICIIAIDPSSEKTGGALLGDRARFNLIEGKKDVFIRSMSNKAEFGGLSEDTYPSIVLMKSIFDYVIVETVGTGQSEIEIENYSDLVIYCAQPASGDFLQYMKAGIMEIPDIVIITKLDLGQIAYDMINEINSIQVLGEEKNQFSIIPISSKTGEGFTNLREKIKIFFKNRKGVNKNKHKHWIIKKFKKIFGQEIFHRMNYKEKLYKYNFSEIEKYQYQFTEDLKNFLKSKNYGKNKK